MKIIYEYSHLGGSEILRVRYPKYEQEIYDVIAQVRGHRTKVSQEKTKMGRALYSPIDMNEQFHSAFHTRGFSELRDTYTITIPNSNTAISGAYKQVDFVKEKVLVEVQFGKYAFMFYDMAKFQYFFNENKADVGIEIVPCHGLHKEMSSGVSYGEQLVLQRKVTSEKLKLSEPFLAV
jgi:hypothetical protein